MSLNKDNLIVGFLVLAIIVAVGGTWMNLTKMQGITGHGIVTAANQNFDIDLSDISGAFNPEGGQITGGGEVTDVDDCYLSSNSTPSPIPAVHPGACGGNATLANYNITISANHKHNISFRWANATGTAGWLDGSTSWQYLGHSINTSGDLGTGTRDLTGWVNNSDSSWVLAYHDLPSGSRSFSTVIALTVDPLESQGVKTNVLQTRLLKTT